MSYRISSGAGLTVFYLIKIDSTHGQGEKESQALQSGNFSKQMIDKSHLKHVTLGCRDMEEYLFHLTSLVCWNKFYISEYCYFPFYGHKDHKHTVKEQ